MGVIGKMQQYYNKYLHHLNTRNMDTI